MRPRPNSIFYLAATLAGTVAGAVVLTLAAAVHRYRQRRAWKQVHAL